MIHTGARSTFSPVLRVLGQQYRRPRRAQTDGWRSQTAGCPKDQVILHRWEVVRHCECLLVFKRVPVMLRARIGDTQKVIRIGRLRTAFSLPGLARQLQPRHELELLPAGGATRHAGGPRCSSASPAPLRPNHRPWPTQHHCLRL